jgi:hypothetical protein
MILPPDRDAWPFDEGDSSRVEVPALPARVTADPENVEKGLVQLVLQLVELLRDVMEKQAIRRVEEGDLSDEQLDRLGETLMLLDRRMTELREHFGLSPEDLKIDLGPLNRLWSW